MKEYDIFNIEDLRKSYSEIANEFKNAIDNESKMPKKKIVITEWRKSKTPKQHKTFFLCANELRKAFYNEGSVYTVEQMKEFIKIAYGYSEEITLPNGRVVTMAKSIADLSEDVNSKVMQEMINFSIDFAQDNLNYTIQINKES